MTERHRQDTLSVYGDGPFDADLGHHTGCEDVATLRLLPGFTIVRTEYLDKLEEPRNGVWLPWRPTDAMMAHFAGCPFHLLSPAKQANEYKAYEAMLKAAQES